MRNWIRILLVLCAGFVSILLLYLMLDIQNIGVFSEGFKANVKILMEHKSFPILSIIISAPVAFMIWFFRDQNATQQIENQRKDINLKEFQKIAEWVSGQHLTEYEVTQKETLEDGKKNIEQTTKYGMPNTWQSILTFSKSDGAVGLQIAAIYSLLPFFRGDHGESFRRPALNLLTSAWLSLQQKELLVLEKLDVLTQEKEFDSQIENIQKRATSPIGVALTQVLLSDGGDNLLKFPEVFPNLCLAGMDFHLPGLDKKVLDLFHRAQNCQGINLVGAKLEDSNLVNVNLHSSFLNCCQLSYSDLNNADLRYSNFIKANLKHSNLDRAKLECSNSKRADLRYSTLGNNILRNISFQGCNFSKARLDNVSFIKSNLQGACFTVKDLNCILFDNGYVVNNELILHSEESDDIYFYQDDEVLKCIKERGGVLIYPSKEPFSLNNSKILKIKQENKIYTHLINFDIDLTKTQQENPDWQISLEDI